MAGSGLEEAEHGRCYLQSAYSRDGIPHYREPLQSKLCSRRAESASTRSGCGALSAGCIPVVDDTYLHRRLLDKLPAVFAADWSVVTPQFLRAQYVEIHRRAGSFEMSRLLAQRVRGEVSVRHRKG